MNITEFNGQDSDGSVGTGPRTLRLPPLQSRKARRRLPWASVKREKTEATLAVRVPCGAQRCSSQVREISMVMSKNRIGVDRQCDGRHQLHYDRSRWHADTTSTASFRTATTAGNVRIPLRDSTMRRRRLSEGTKKRVKIETRTSTLQSSENQAICQMALRSNACLFNPFLEKSLTFASDVDGGLQFCN
jgi:hypothetical protein